jgi:hypothetical protein
MSQPQEPRTGGVAVTRRYAVAFPGIEGYAYRETRQPGPADGLTIIVGDEYGTWFPLAEAEALEGKVIRLEAEVTTWKRRLVEESERLRALLAEARAEALIDPNDPAVRERLAEEINEFAISASMRPLGAPWPDPYEAADAALDALRSKP